MKLMEFLIKVAAAALVLTTVAEALWLEVPTTGTKCVSEELHINVVVLANYAVIGDEEHAQANVLPTVSVTVSSPFGNNLHREENVTYGTFGFTTSEAGNYMACFWMNSHAPGSKGVTLGIDWKTGVATKDWDSIAKKEKIEGVGVELMKLEGVVQAIRENLVYLKQREVEMREVSERTNARVAWFSIMSLGIGILAAAVQVWYLTRFFRKKKLI